MITSAASTLAAATFVLSLAVPKPVAAQSAKITYVASQPAQPGVPAATLAPDGTTFGPWHGYYPVDLQAAYSIDSLHAEGITGTGQTIVIVAMYGSPTALQDLQVYSQTFGLPAPDLTVIYPGGAPSDPQAKQFGWAQETSLDLQCAHAVAPGARLVLLAATSPENMDKAVAYAVEHYPGAVISLSWGQSELCFGPAVDPQLAKSREAFGQAVAARCTVVAGSGDWGTANFDKQDQFYSIPNAFWPASDPLVTGVGGTWLQYGWRWDPLISATQLTLTGDLASYLNSKNAPNKRTEAVWKEDWSAAIGAGPSVTGGGLSALFGTPDFQQGLSQSLLQGRRGVPDLACNAAHDGGVVVYCSQGWAPQPFSGPWGLAGGTSAATPEVAGMVALANQLRSQRGKLPIGYLNAVLYTLPARDFNDVVPQTFGSGDATALLDDNAIFGLATPVFQTTAGYDLTTGLGSPNAHWFVHDLADTP